jgi:hypothetical protein
MRFRILSAVMLSGLLVAAGCGGGLAALEVEDPAVAERAKERKLRNLMRDAQGAFAMPDLDEGAADEEEGE